MKEPWEDMPEPLELYIPDKIADELAELYEQMHDEMMDEYFSRALRYFDDVRDDFYDETIIEAMKELAARWKRFGYRRINVNGK